MKKLLLSAAFVALGTSAHAVTATFDFAELADTLPPVGDDTNAELLVVSDNGLGILLDADGDDFAYLDATIGSKGRAGLGVCQNPNCVGVDDDNINPGESVTLRFSNVVTDITGLGFRNNTHTGPAVGTFSYRVVFSDLSVGVFDGVDFNVGALSFGALGINSISFGNVDGASFYLSDLTADYDPDRQTPPVPLPAGLPLLVGGLAALGFAGRRRKKA